MTNQSFNPNAFANLASFEEGFWWFKARNKILLWALKTKVGKFTDFIEVGCGTGFVLSAVQKTYPDAKYTGAEYYEEGLVYAKQRIPSAKFMQLDATKISEADCYDVIGAFDVIEHIVEDELVLENLANALRLGGTLMITVPQHQWLWSETDISACHVRRYSRTELVNKVKQSGLQVVYVTSFVSFLLPIMWLSRLMNPSTNNSQSQNNKVSNETNFKESMREFQIPGWLNFILELIMDLEILLLKIGIRLPIGGSLLLIAKKN